MTKAVLLDDEAHCNEAMQRMLCTHFSDIEVISVFSSPKDFLEFAPDNRFDLLFIDIRMPGKTGFQVLEKIGQYDFKVVFVTAYDQYAIKAFQYSAIDYLLKPVSDEDLIACVDRIRKREQSKVQLEIVKEILQRIPDEKARVVIPSVDSYEFVFLKDITRCEADRNYCKIWLNQGEHPVVCSRPLKEIEKLLENGSFLRVHNSHLVNIQKIKRFLKTDNCLELLDGSIVPVSRMRKDWVLERLIGYSDQ
ncbi:LytR/AlgR family response regulator transcription factor [Jiulongibacter sp. NS-SX5]|uniref:LytR/AlgR family response regulator transcription factor n=1 Tax=Jiulongibacter sp. NS-SX5 TaxID=3463854 RepID=UPI004059076F